MRKLKVGVVGCGLVAQWMHLPYLQELEGFEIAAVCDISPRVVEAVGERFGVEQRFTDYNQMLEKADLDTVFVLNIIHSDPAIAAARAGKHVLCEKPMCFNLREASAMVEAAAKSGVKLMLAYMKRYDPGYRHGRDLMQQMPDVQFIRVHDLCGPNEATLRDLIHPIADEETSRALAAETRAEIRRRIEVALGSGLPEKVYNAHGMLGGLASHDIGVLRGAFGSPRGVLHTEIWHEGRYILSLLDYGDERKCTFEIGSMQRRGFDEELVAFGTQSSVAIRFPNPFLKNAPTMVQHIEERDGVRVEENITTNYQEAFRCELEHFYDCVVNDKTPETSGTEGIKDMQLQIEIAKTYLKQS